MTALRPLYLDCGAAAVRLEGPALIVDQPDCCRGTVSVAASLPRRRPRPGAVVDGSALRLPGERRADHLPVARRGGSRALPRPRAAGGVAGDAARPAARRAGLGRDLRALVEGGGAAGDRRGGAPPGPAARHRSAAGGGARAGGGADAGRRHARRALGDAPPRRLSGGPSERALRPGRGAARISRRTRLAARSAARLSRARCAGICGCRSSAGWSCGRVIRRRAAGRVRRAVAPPRNTRPPAPQIAARFRRLVASLDRLLREEVR